MQQLIIIMEDPKALFWSSKFPLACEKNFFEIYGIWARTLKNVRQPLPSHYTRITTLYKKSHRPYRYFFTATMEAKFRNRGIKWKHNLEQLNNICTGSMKCGQSRVLCVEDNPYRTYLHCLVQCHLVEKSKCQFPVLPHLPVSNSAT